MLRVDPESPEALVVIKSVEILTSPAPVPIPTPAPRARSVLRWLPKYYRRVLFPGDGEAPAAVCWRSLTILVVLSSLILYPMIGFELFEPDEGRYAQIPREMLENREWIVPTLQGEPYLDKPPLFYWLVMAAFQVFGMHAWAARLVPALAMQACLLATYFFGRWMVGERPAWWGTLFAAVSPLFLGMGRLLVLDGLLTLWVCLSLYACFLAQHRARLSWGWWLVAAGAAGLGVLTKGPIALVLLLPPLVLHRRLAREVSCAIPWRAWACFFMVVVAIALPCYVAILVVMPDFGPYFFLKHNVQRFLEPFDHIKPVWYFGPILLAGMLPLTLLAWPTVRFLLSDETTVKRHRSAAFGYLLLSAAWCVFFFSLSGCKLPTYILPALAPLSLAMGVVLSRLDDNGFPWATWRNRIVCISAAIMLLAQNMAVPILARQWSPMRDEESLRVWCADPAVPVAVFSRNLDAISFHLGRSDFVTFPTKDLGDILDFMDQHPKVVILFGHKSAKHLILDRIPTHLRVVHQGPVGLTEMAVIERIEGHLAPRKEYAVRYHESERGVSWGIPHPKVGR